MQEVGQAIRSPGRIYFTGGVTAVLFGWRESTMDVDLKADPEPAGFFETLPKLKDKIDINIELAAPDDFVPAFPEWRERSIFIERQGHAEFFHYDLYGQALSKLERLHERDEIDVARMLSDRLVEPAKLWQLFSAVEEKLIRYPAIDPKKLRMRVKKIADEGKL